jgi:SAM-dependent methyltransferase
LREHYKIEGMDLDDQMLEVARQKFPSVKLHCADMTNFDLGRQFDVVTCLFSAIGYAKTVERMNRAISRMAAHTKAGGLLIVEPWLTPEQYRGGQVHALYEDRPNLKIVRMNTSEVRGDLSILEFHYLVGTPSGVEYFTETHETGLFTEEQYRNAFEAVGMDVEFDPAGLMGRGLWIATRP